MAIPIDLAEDRKVAQLCAAEGKKERSKALWQQVWRFVLRLEREIAEPPHERGWQKPQGAIPTLRLLGQQPEQAAPPPKPTARLAAEPLPARPPWAKDAETPTPSTSVASSPLPSATSQDWPAAISDCQACGLGQEATRIRQQAMIGYPEQRLGQPQSVILLLVCDAPNYDADRAGLPLDPDSLAYLEKWLQAIRLSQAYYLTNLVKCRTPGNRAPWPEEVKHCAPHLEQQLAYFRPQALLALGSSAARSLSQQRSGLEALRQSSLSYSFQGKDIPLFVTYSVREVLHNPNELRAPVWQDLKRLHASLQQK